MKFSSKQVDYGQCGKSMIRIHVSRSDGTAFRSFSEALDAEIFLNRIPVIVAAMKAFMKTRDEKALSILQVYLGKE